MSLLDETIARIHAEAAQAVATSQAHAGLFAEAEALSAQLREHLPHLYHYTGDPVASVGFSGVITWVQFSFMPADVVVEAIEKAGLRIARRTPDRRPGSTEIRLEGLSTHIVVAAPLGTEAAA